MALGMTQPVTEMSTGNISWGVKVAGGLDWQLYHLHVPIVHEIWEPQNPGALMVCPDLCRDSFTFTLKYLNDQLRSRIVLRPHIYFSCSYFITLFVIVLPWKFVRVKCLLCLVLKFSAWFLSDESNIFSSGSRGVKLETSGFSHSKRQVFPTAEPSLVKSSHPLP